MENYNIQAASIISGVTVHQIRAWEKRYGAVNPTRLNNNFRSYNCEDVKRLRMLGLLSRKGLSISKIASENTSELEIRLKTIETHESALDHKGPKVEESAGMKEKLPLLLNFLELRRYDLIIHEVLKLDTFASLSQVLLPFLRHLVTSPLNWQGPETRSLIKIIMDQAQKVSSSINE
jgi:DNA-binding transcriptional MerR regulator